MELIGIKIYRNIVNYVNPNFFFLAIDGESATIIMPATTGPYAII